MKQTWSPEHPHAHDSTWRAPSAYNLGRTVTWSWAKCATCGAKTAVSPGAGHAICDECFTTVSGQNVE